MQNKVSILQEPIYGSSSNGEIPSKSHSEG